MQSRKLWLNTSIFKNVVIRNLLPAKISLLLFGGFILLGIVSESAYQLSILIFFLSAFLLTTLYAGIIQGYLSNTTEAAYTKSLPISTKEMWFIQYLSGYSIVFITLLIEILAGFIVDNVQKGRLCFFSGASIHRLVFALVILTFIYYSISFFVVCISGKRIGQFLFTVAFYFVPSCIHMGIAYVGNILTIANTYHFNFERFTFNYTLFSPVSSGIAFLTQFHYAFTWDSDWEQLGEWQHLYLHITIGIVFFIASYFAYKHRPLEKAKESIVYPIMNYSIRILLVVATTLILYLLIMKIGNIHFCYSGQQYYIVFTLFISIGIVVALLLELLFKNIKIYRMLILYIPVLVAFAFGCIVYGEYTHVEAKEHIHKHSTMLSLHLYEGDEVQVVNITECDIAYAQQLIQWVNEHPEYVYSTNSEERKIVKLYFARLDYAKKDNEGYELGYYVDEEAFQNYLENKNPELLTYLLEHRDIPQSDLLSLEYLSISKEETRIAILDSEGIKQLSELLEKSDKGYEDLFSDVEQEYIGESRSVYVQFKGNPQIEELLQQPQYVEKINMVERTQETLNNWDLMGYLKEQEIFKKCELSQMEKYEEIEAIGDDFVTYYMFIDLQSSSLNIELNVTVTNIDGKGTVTDVALLRVYPYTTGEEAYD